MQKSIYTEQYGLLLATLRDARKAAGLSQVELASRLELTQSIVGKCERGERRLDVIELREWCHAIGMTLGQLVDELESAISRFEVLKSTAGKAPRSRSK
ncbi:XRE family transcriptional regulator [Burkholderia multivorans]|uniref:helix-turn-helix domain-containing protein n=1 Tax=Burkholderia multivorans TaxID=87883 RepID=UPI000CFE60BC|nr:helix-turn-helix transcriptional regulator [Burkholderia multivorans]AYY98909.1 XRE family transcriptional regulator [Burkholderia multivorans]MBU9118622.1 helix-turn-helix domain-containing protein [Burkholderia multivorans]PRF46506.1 transcriptional regulator [Burkholderia multivorans]PRG45619.1 transcriptional regulator [Burkholderia multivorans]